MSHQPAPEPEPIAFEELSARCLGRIDFMQKVLGSFTSRFEEDLRQLENELSVHNADRVGQLAHRMKGACGNVAAGPLLEQVARIEKLARDHLLEEVPPCVNKLHEEWARVRGSAESFAASGHGS